MKSISRLAIVLVFVLRGLNALRAQDEPNPNPLDEVTREMKVAAEHLGKRATDKPTQKAQDDAVSKLDSLIVELEKQRSALGNGANPNPTRPADQSSVRTGPGGMGDLHGAKMQGDRWGELPAHERDRILQSLTEGFPPHYQAVLEAYYKRLAVEKRGEETDASPEPKTSAASKSNVKTNPMKPTPPVPMKSLTPMKKSDK